MNTTTYRRQGGADGQERLCLRRLGGDGCDSDTEGTVALTGALEKNRQPLCMPGEGGQVSLHAPLPFAYARSTITKVSRPPPISLSLCLTS